MDSSPQPGPSHLPGIAVTTFDERTAEAVVVVLERADIRAWTAPSTVAGDVEVMVEEGRREAALRALTEGMDDVREVTAELHRQRSGGSSRFTRRAADTRAGEDEDDEIVYPEELRDGPPLVMERFRNLSWVLAILLVPLMVVALAPTIRSDMGIRIAIGVAVVVIGAIVFRRKR